MAPGIMREEEDDGSAESLSLSPPEMIPARDWERVVGLLVLTAVDCCWLALRLGETREALRAAEVDAKRREGEGGRLAVSDGSSPMRAKWRTSLTASLPKTILGMKRSMAWTRSRRTPSSWLRTTALVSLSLEEELRKRYSRSLSSRYSSCSL